MVQKFNVLYCSNLVKGQIGLLVVFDLLMQIGYDSDYILVCGEVGKVGVLICYLGDMWVLFDQIFLEQMNILMMINVIVFWLLVLYIVVVEEQGVDVMVL